MICPDCGKEIVDGSKFCSKCGTKIETVNNPGENKNVSSFLSNSEGSVTKNKAVKKALIAIAALGIIGGLSIYFWIFFFSPSARYTRAERAFRSGDYKKAVDLYSSAGDYEDAKRKLEKAEIAYHYANAERMIAEEDYQNAIVELQQSNNYGEARELLLLCHYSLGEKNLNEKNFDAAKTEFQNTSGYKDADEKIQECDYEKGCHLLENGEGRAAAEAFILAGRYKDANEKAIAIARNDVENKNYEDAIAIFEMANAKENPYYQYAKGIGYMEAGNYSDASTCFKKASAILDAKELYTETNYEYAREMLQKGNYSVALRQFQRNPDYKDSADLINASSLLLAKSDMEEGDLARAKDALENLPAEYGYEGVTVAALLELLNRNSQWIAICGTWKSTGGEMRSQQSGSYNYYYWHRDIRENALSIDVKCRLNDDGTVTVMTTGSIPVYTSYSSLSEYLEETTISLFHSEKMSGLGTIKINDFLSVTLSNNRISANYKKVDRSKDVYFDYTYTTDVTYGKKVSSN